MANLHVMGPFEGPGEEKTAETLAQELPQDWEVIAGRKLPGADRADTDLIVMGKGSLFLMEEKAWGPSVIVDDVIWKTSRRDYRNPLDRVGYLSRRLASLLSDRIPDYRTRVGRRHLVRPGVALSHDNLLLDFGPGFDSEELVVGLKSREASEKLKTIDRASENLETGLREEILSVLVGLSQRELDEMRIGIYSIDGEDIPIGPVKQFLTIDPMDSTPLVLQCIPMHGWGSAQDLTTFFSNEARAQSDLLDLDRSWQTKTSFEDQIHNYWVTPLVRPTESRNLVYSVRSNDPPRIDGRLQNEVAQSVVADAFLGLSEIHGVGLIHRGFSPNRIWLGRKLRVKFTDFVLAKNSDEKTISSFLDEFSLDPSSSYRAPECAHAPELASPRSDVFSLALCLSIWILNASSLNVSFEEIKAEIETYPVIGRLLGRCLQADLATRPLAAEMYELVQEAIAYQKLIDDQENDQALSQDWSEDLLVDGHFSLIKELGSGGSATSWLATNTTTHEPVVLKRFNGDQWEDALKEYRAAFKLSSDHLAVVVGISNDPDPTYLVYRYVDGKNLKSFFKENSKIKAEECLRICLDVLEGLRYMHSKSILHGDVTPGNVIVTPEERAVLIDFGLTGESTESIKGLTREFAAPELLAGSVSQTVKTDLFGFASSMLTCMIGRSIYPDLGDGTLATNPQPPTAEEESLWGPLGASIIKSLKKGIEVDPNERPSSAEDFQDLIRLSSASDVTSGEEVINPTVENMRGLYRASAETNSGMLGVDDPFARETYLRTKLDEVLPAAVLGGEFSLVALTGNPGDGKTSFLTMFYDQVKSASNFQSVRFDTSGWEASVGDLTIVAINDASESQGSQSADDILKSVLQSNQIGGSQKRVVLLAVNDGRLLQFFTDNSDYFPEYSRSIKKQLREGAQPSEGVVVIDLKRRSLASLKGEDSLALQVVDILTGDSLWEECDTCLAREVCPILANVRQIRSGGRLAIEELVLTSHLRRRYRATFRDLRSSLSWIIAKDRSCEEIHAARKEGQDLRKADNSLTSDLAFDSSSADFLVNEWSDLDPGRIAAPEIERESRKQGMFVEDHETTHSQLSRIQRDVFFRKLDEEKFPIDRVRAYRYFDDFINGLLNPSELLKIKLLLGLSRIAGSPGFELGGLAIATSDSSSSWSILKVVDPASFALISNYSASRFIETIPDGLQIRYEDRVSFDLTLDTFELLLRASNGEIFNDQFSDALREEVDGFASQLRRQPSEKVLVFDSLGAVVTAERKGLVIELEEGSVKNV